MSKKLFITGTGTDIGKTYVTALILKKLHTYNLKAAYFKAAVSGNKRDERGKLIPGDAVYVKSISGIDQSPETMCPFVYENAVSPHLAAKIEGQPVELETVIAELNSLESSYDFITLEGSGGIICPLRYDDKVKLLLGDFIKKADADCLIVADAGLGTINSVVLTAEYMQNHNICARGIIFNNYEYGDPLHEDNIKMCEELTGLKVIATVARGADELDISLDKLLSLYR